MGEMSNTERLHLYEESVLLWSRQIRAVLERNPAQPLAEGKRLFLLPLLLVTKIAVPTFMPVHVYIHYRYIVYWSREEREVDVTMAVYQHSKCQDPAPCGVE